MCQMEILAVTRLPPSLNNKDAVVQAKGSLAENLLYDLNYIFLPKPA